jgi:UDP-N-acetylglucosamine acyltransferase
MPSIHPTAIVDAGAQLADDVEIGPYAVLGPSVSVGAGTVIGPFTRIEGHTTIGERNRIFGHSSFGTEPQDFKYKGEKTGLLIGNDNVFREFMTVNRGTPGGGGLTRVGSHCYFMVYSHIAHDCQVGNEVLFANAGTLAGHVEVGDHAVIGAFSAVHQFCRVGEHAFMGGFTVATQDVLPYVKTVGNRPAKTYGINTIGLQRNGFPPETVEALQKAYRWLTRSKLKLEEALGKIETELSHVAEARYLVNFIREAKRGIVR